MDRRGHHRPVLSRTSLLAGWMAAGWLAVAGSVGAQPPVVSPVPSVAVPPAAPAPAATPDLVLRRRGVERHQRDLATGEQEVQRRLEQLPPEEREAFKRNLRVWRQMSPEEREAVRKEAGDRTREEVERAYQQSGLHLDKDQREVFGLRYRQERRKIERELQEKLEVERARRLPGLVEGLRKEFADKSSPAPSEPLATGAALPTPAVRATPSVSVPAAPSLPGR